MNMNMVKETIETSAWTDRELQLRTYYQTVETNGSVRRHEIDLYGDPTRGVVGLKQVAAENAAYRERAKVGVRIACAVGGVAATAIFAILGILLAAHMGGQ